MTAFVNAKEARRLFQISNSTLRRWDKEGRIQTIRSPSTFRLYSTHLYEASIRRIR